MSDLEMYSLLVGFFLPLGISVVQQPRWPDGLRAVCTFVLCAVAGLGTAYFQGDLTGRRVISAVLLVLVAALTSYRNFWKPTRLAPALEAATSPGS